MKTKVRNKHRGSSLESFLKKEELYEEVHAGALKRCRQARGSLKGTKAMEVFMSERKRNRAS